MSGVSACLHPYLPALMEELTSSEMAQGYAAWGSAMRNLERMLKLENQGIPF